MVDINSKNTGSVVINSEVSTSNSEVKTSEVNLPTLKQERFSEYLVGRAFNGRVQVENVKLFQELATNPSAMSGLTVANLVDSLAVMEDLASDGKIEMDVYLRAKIAVGQTMANMSRTASTNQKDRYVEAKLSADSINRLMKPGSGKSVYEVVGEIKSPLINVDDSKATRSEIKVDNSKLEVKNK